MFPEHSVIIIDEVGMIWDNRQFKNFKPEVRDWFKLQRHYKVKVVMASQTFDVDKKLRDLCDSMFLLEKKFRVFSYGKRIIRKLTIIEASDMAESRITDSLAFDSLFFFWAGSRTLTFIPHWAPYFDSFSAPALPEGDFQYIPPIDEVKRKDWLPIFISMLTVQVALLKNQILHRKNRD